jgi:hypothetical protein
LKHPSKKTTLATPSLLIGFFNQETLLPHNECREHLKYFVDGVHCF